MDEFPVVKGWVPFKSIGTDLQKNEKKLQKEKAKENYKNKGVDCEGLSVPKDWKAPAFKFEDNPHKRLFAESEFKVKFPTKLTDYLKETFPIAQKAMEEHFIKAQLILNEGEMVVTTTRKTYDPAMIIKAHGVIKLLARFVPVDEAIKVLEDDLSEDIIEIGHRKKETFINRKKRLAEPSIIQLIEEILQCKVFIGGKTVAAIGSYTNLNKVRTIVSDLFEKNIHPIYQLKRLQLFNKFKSMPEMEGKDWSAFVPPLKKKNVKRKKPLKVREKKEYSVFPPAPAESKIDKELASGLFHLKYEKKGKSYYRLIDKEKTKEEEKQKIKDENKMKKKEEQQKIKEEEKLPHNIKEEECEVPNKKRKRVDSDETPKKSSKKSKSVSE